MTVDEFDRWIILIALCAKSGIRDPSDLGQALVGWRYRLLPDELPLLEQVAKGRTTEEMAIHFEVDAETIKDRLSKLYKKLQVANRVQAARLAGQYGLGSD